MADLTSKRLIVLKGLLFLAGAAVASLLILLEQPSLRTALLLAVALWCSARWYYFAFYVIERYVDSSYRFAGIWSAVLFLWRRRG